MPSGKGDESSRSGDRREIADVDASRPPLSNPQGDDGGDNLKVLASLMARELIDAKCVDAVLFDVRGLSQLTHFILVASGTSDRQMRSAARDLTTLAKEHGTSRYGDDQDEAATWIVVDFVDIMVHLFEPATRAHYDLEMMWGDAPQVNWHKEVRDIPRTKSSPDDSVSG